MKKITWQRIFFILIFILLIAFLIFWLTFKGSVWRYYPLTWQEKIAWNKLKASNYNDPMCHENCLAERGVLKKVLIASYEKNQTQFLEKVKLTLTNKNENEQFKVELVKLLSGLNENNEIDFNYLKDYQFSESERDFRLAVSQYLGLDSFGNLEEIKENVFNDSMPLSQRYDSLVLLSQLEKEPDFSFYEELIGDEKNLELRKRAITNILYQNDPSVWLSEKMEISLEEIIADNKQDLELQKLALALLVESNNKEKLIVFLTPIFSDQNRNKFLRSYVFDYLNQLVPNKYQEPAISATEWAEYEKKLTNN